MFIAANGLKEKQAALFLSIVGAGMIALFPDLASPTKSSAKKFQELYDALHAHFEPQSIVIVDRYYFHSQNEGSTETTAEFMAELPKLPKLTMHCQFGEQLNEALCDHLVWDLRNSAIQKRLLMEADLDLPKSSV